MASGVEMKHIDTRKLEQAERLIHDWLAEHQVGAPDLAFKEAVKAELAAMDAVNFCKAGL